MGKARPVVVDRLFLSPDITAALAPRRSRPLLLWSVVATISLTIIFLQTRCNGKRNSNFFLNSDSASVGAYVFIDGTISGQVKRANNSGLSGGAFRCHLNNGRHLLEVRKPGYRTFQKALDFEGQDYLGLCLEK